MAQRTWEHSAAQFEQILRQHCLFGERRERDDVALVLACSNRAALPGNDNERMSNRLLLQHASADR